MAKLQEIVLIGWGKTSEPFAKKVKKHLEDDFGFRVYMPKNMKELRACFIDNETRVARPASELTDGSITDKVVYICQDTRIYDNRLVNASEKIETVADQILKEMNDPVLASEIHTHTTSEAVKKFYYQISQRAKDLKNQSNTLTRLTKPKFAHNHVPTEDDPYSYPEQKGPQFSSIEHLPDREIRKLEGTLTFLVDAKAAHIGAAFRKSSYEWSHHHEKALKEKGMWEMNTLKMIIGEMGMYGANSLIYLHPHAPKEGLEYAQNAGIHYLNINHQGNSTVDGKNYNLLEFFGEHTLNMQFAFPFDHHLKDLQESFDRYKADRCFIDGPDEGSWKASKEFAERNGLSQVTSKKFRKDEGDSEISSTQTIDSHLDRLRMEDSYATLTFIILDDKVNTAGTANEEALTRKRQVAEYNTKYGTNFKVSVELWCTHLRNPYIVDLKHDNLDRIVVLDTVPYIPELPEQLEAKGLREKITILRGASYQIAEGIALDYALNALPVLKGQLMRRAQSSLEL